MDEKRFWLMFEDAWQSVGGFKESRRKLVKGELTEQEAIDLAGQSWSAFVPALKAMLEQLPQEELLEFDRILERKLYDIDRADIHEYTDGGDDGFLYCRAFIVAAGQEYYDAVNVNPSLAMMDQECEDLIYLPVHVYQARFGNMPESGISRETGFNKSGWPASTD